MVKKNKQEKPVYEPPRVLNLDEVSLVYGEVCIDGVGATAACTPFGDGARGNCDDGPGPGGSCSPNGTGASSACSAGTNPGASCNPGTGR